MKSAKHKSNMQAVKGTSDIKKFFSSSSDDANLRNSAAIAECALVFHTVNHSHSYLSFDCTGKLLSQLFAGSKIAQRYSCGRTKATQIAKQVLAPETRMRNMRDLENNHPFSLATDASNKDSLKSGDIANCLISHLEAAELTLTNVTAFCADMPP
ncbi:unnamed protein product [Ceutorhynchus assimilis]|uniref:Uncharacterized protein n=1 Tax=Ceutorhynchus assimilis TaxID=467358 RepID=A0A9N9MPG7_9CUCU|nr:unnamed protein product [Ceutorhynchus assimilis]